MSQSEGATSDSEQTSRTSQVREELLPLRRIAPRAPPPQANYEPALLAARYRRGLTWDGRCEVCFSRSCSLSSHRLCTQSKRGLLAKHTTQQPSTTDATAFTSSYVAVVNTWFTDEQLEPKWPFALPISANLDQDSMKRLLRDWFVVQAPSLLTIPRPPEVANELVHSPFLLPALNDALLCQSILAVSASTQQSIPQPDRRVLALTLFDQAMVLLRTRVTGDTLQLDDNTIAAAVYLWHANLVLADDDSLEGHAKSIQALISARGGIEKLGMFGAVANLLRWTEILFSIRMHKPCRYILVQKFPVWEDVGGEHGTFWTQHSNETMPVSDKSIIQACQDCNQLIAYLEVCEPAEIEPAEYQFLCLKACQLFQESSVARARLFKSKTLEECIILTIDLLKVLLFMGCAAQSSRWDVKTLCTSVVEAVRTVGPQSLGHYNTNLLVWILFVVRSANHESVAQEWTKRTLRSVLESKLGENRRNWTAERQMKLQSMLVSFGWSPTIPSMGIERILLRLFE